MLNEILDKFAARSGYHDLDRKALNISRSAAGGSFTESDYADWALISNDPVVMVNSIKTYVTILTARLSAAPFRPEDEELKTLGTKLRLNSLFTELYTDVLQDGYAYVVIGMEANGTPVVRSVDARHILFNGDDPSLADATDLVIFDIQPKEIGDMNLYTSIPAGYVEYDNTNERVIVNYYHKTEDGYVLDIYEDNDNFTSYPLEGFNRIPVVRFIGDKVELSDKKVHYRGLYHQVGSVLKAMTLSATQIQTQTAMLETDNYMADIASVANHQDLWRSSGIKTYDTVDGNGHPIAPPIPLVKDFQFPIASFNLWKSVIGDMLGPIVQSGTNEAITQEEVKARNELRDAISSMFLQRIVDSISAVYTCINIFLKKDTTPVVIVSGFLESVKRTKHREELAFIYGMAKESGLNTQGFAYEQLWLSDLELDVKQRLQQTFNADPNASPMVKQLKDQIQQLQGIIQQAQHTEALMKTQITQRLERQNNYIEMVERNKRADIALKQWLQEAKDAQQARLEMMKAMIAAGNTEGAVALLAQMETRDNLLLTVPEQVQTILNVPQQQLELTPSVQVPPQIMQPPGAPPQHGVVPNGT